MEPGQEILDNRYKVVKKLGNGAFGDIYEIEKKKSGERLAAKVQRIGKSATKAQNQMLFWESKLIHKLRGKTSVPKIHHVGDEKTIDGRQFHIMVMDLLGKSLEEQFQACRKQFDLTTCLHIGAQMVRMIKVVHEDGIIHRDIKPDNFLVGGTTSTKRTIYMIDFGLGKCYKNTEGEHIAFKDGKNLTGSARYASLNTHLGYEQSRRDDLEMIGYVILYFLRGSLPWQGLPGKTKQEKYEAIKLKKQQISMDELCKDQPNELKMFMKYCRNLGFQQEPNYDYIIELFDQCMTNNRVDKNKPDFVWLKTTVDTSKRRTNDKIEKTPEVNSPGSNVKTTE